MIVGTSNAVNLTDGLDGLAIGASMMVFARLHARGASGRTTSTARFKPGPQCYNDIRDPLDLAVVAAAITGACFGFLWWNASPARIIMGDTGSLSLGAAMAGFAIMTRTELLLVVLGGLFAVVTLSVILQVGLLQAHRRQAAVQDGAAASPLRAARVGGGHDRHQVLADLRDLRGRRAGDLLRGVGRRAREPSMSRTPAGLAPDAGRPSPWPQAPGLRGRRARRLRLRGLRRPGRRSAHRSSYSTTRRATSARDAGDAAGDPGGRRPARAPDPRRACRADRGPRRHDAGAAAEHADARRRRSAAGLPVWGEVELAWRLRDPEHAGAMAVRHRHEREDDDRPDARGDAAGRRPARGGHRQRGAAASARWSWTPSRTTSLAVELSSHQLHWMRSLSAAGRRRAERGARPPVLARRPRAIRGREGARSTSSCQLACVYNVEDPQTASHGGGGRGRRGLPGDRLHARDSRRSGCSASWTACSRTGPSSRRAPTARPSSPGSSTCRPAPRTTSRTRLAAAALARAHGVAHRRRPSWPAGLPPRPASDRDRGDRRRGDAMSTTPRRRTRMRRRPRCWRSTTVVWVAGGLAKGAEFDELVTARAGPAAGRGAARRGPGPDRGRAFATRAGCAGDRRTGHATLVSWNASSLPPRRLPSPATRCCWPRRARPRTCSRAMRHVVTRSPRRSRGSASADARLHLGTGSSTVARLDDPGPGTQGRVDVATVSEEKLVGRRGDGAASGSR